MKSRLFIVAGAACAAIALGTPVAQAHLQGNWSYAAAVKSTSGLKFTSSQSTLAAMRAANAVSGPSRSAPAQLLPELAQSQHAFVRQITGDDRAVDRADRSATYPIRRELTLVERLKHPRLIRA